VGEESEGVEKFCAQVATASRGCSLRARKAVGRVLTDSKRGTALGLDKCM
jgi:hypothetical protein